MNRVTIYGVDPGTRESALVMLDAHTRTVIGSCTETNDTILGFLYDAQRLFDLAPLEEQFSHERILVVEQIEAMGMSVGREVFETVWWAGRFHQVWRGARTRMPRRDVKLHLCGTMRAKDKHIRQALIDKFGGATAIGKKNNPGPLYGIKAHEFAALAVALTFADLHLKDKPGGGK